MTPSQGELKLELHRMRVEARFRAWSATPRGRANRRRLEGLRDLHKGRRCFVMGNGPSLLKCDLNRLAGEITIVSNAHYLIWEQLTYVPTFLTVEDRLVAEDRAAELCSLPQITKTFAFDLRHWLGEASEKTLYLNVPRHYQPFPQFSFELTKRAYWGGTVSYINLQLAAFLGCNPIVLIGFDHSYQVPEAEIVDHVISSTVPDVNHIHPSYFGPGYRWHDPNVKRMELAYRCGREALENAGIQVVNATVGGQLEIFPRASYESIVSA